MMVEICGHGSYFAIALRRPRHSHKYPDILEDV